MSYYIKIHGWSGQNPGNTATRMAKVFRMQDARAEAIMRNILKGEPWQFEYPVSPAQSEEARMYLRELGYDVELVPALKPQKPATAKKAPVETLKPPVEEGPSRKSLPDLLKKVNAAWRKIGAPRLHSKSPKKSDVALSLVILSLLAAVTALPCYLGMQTETALNDLMPQLFQKSAMVQRTSYDPGWLRSTAEYTVKTPGVPLLAVASAIIHDPFPEWMAGDFEYCQARIDFTITPAGKAKHLKTGIPGNICASQFQKTAIPYLPT